MIGRVGRLTGVVALVAAAVWVVPSAAGAGSSCPLPEFGPGRAYHPQIEPANFSPNVTNRLFPLTPGKTLVYTGTKDRKKALNLVATTSRTKKIDGVTTRVVEDRLYLNNVLAERTSDYYAQAAAATSGTSARTPPNSTAMAMSSAPRAPSTPGSTTPSRGCSCRPTRNSAAGSGRSGTGARPRMCSR
jgi:hypothetical protein